MHTGLAQPTHWRDGACLYGFKASSGGLLYLLAVQGDALLKSSTSQRASGECPTKPRPNMDPRYKAAHPQKTQDARTCLETGVFRIILRLQLTRGMLELAGLPNDIAACPRSLQETVRTIHLFQRKASKVLEYQVQNKLQNFRIPSLPIRRPPAKLPGLQRLGNRHERLAQQRRYETYCIYRCEQIMTMAHAQKPARALLYLRL